MIFEVLNDHHVEQAAKLALREYKEERSAVPVLPEGDYYGRFCEMIAKMTGHGLGVAAVEKGKIIGFLTCYEPRDNFFGTAPGTFSPIHGHGTEKDGRRRIYSQLYQAAAEKWVKRGILSHAVALYAHDAEAEDSFYWNGFGLRCVDAIRPVEPVRRGEFPGYTFCELPKAETGRIVPLKNGLIGHLRSTPMFMPYFFSVDEEGAIEESIKRNFRYFAANKDDMTIAYIVITNEGENFTCDDPGTASICGAYMLPGYRGSGVYTGLLGFLIDTLAAEGFSRCGVDFESFNPTAGGFWLKHFTAYTHSVVRRIDERIVRA